MTLTCAVPGQGHAILLGNSGSPEPDSECMPQAVETPLINDAAPAYGLTLCDLTRRLAPDDLNFRQDLVEGL